jgi:NADPH:quinone reductase-like Zn-dependent oxidoreductase
MKAAQFSRFGGPEVLEIVDLSDPHPRPGQVRIVVWAAGVNASDWHKRRGLMDQKLPQTMGYEAAGIVDELGDGAQDVALGDRVFGFCPDGAAQAELAVLSEFAPIPPSLDFAQAAALPTAVETAARALDQLGVVSGSALLINGASGSVGSAAVQLAVARGARVIGTGSPGTHDRLRSLGAEPVTYGDGILDQLIALTGAPEHVVTIADFSGARDHGVRFSRGDSGRATYALGQIGELVESGRFSLPVGQAFPLTDVADAHRVGESGRVRGKLVLRIDSKSHSPTHE